MNKREHYHLNRLLKRQIDVGTLNIEATKSHKHLIEQVLNLQERDIRHDGWYHKGFVFIRFMDDYIQLKTISVYAETKTINIAMSESSLRSYIQYLNKLINAN